LFTFMLQKCFPVMEMGLRYFSPRGGAWRFFEVLRTSTPYWVPWLPWLLLISLGVWWYRSRRAASVETSSWRAAKATCYGGRPSFGSLLHAGRMSVFSDTLALLLEQDVPLHEAVVLGADASADRGLRASCRQLAERLRRGESVRGVPLAGTPPVLSWLLTGVPEKSRLIASLRRAAEAYRRHADWTLRCLSVYLPLWLTVAVGGTAVMLYALSVFGPWCRTLYDLSLPS
jgi:type II secretory pathway component PulF